MGDLKICTQTLIPDLEPHCFDSNVALIQDPKSITEHWSQQICVAARWMPLRALIFSQDLQLAIYPCCHFIHPSHYSDQYKLVQYLPVSGYEKSNNFSRTLIYHVNFVVGTKMDITPFDSGLAIVIVDVQMGRVLVSGRATEVVSYMHGNLDINVDASRSSGVNYNDFISMVSGLPIRQDVQVASTDELHELEKTVQDGFMRIY